MAFRVFVAEKISLLLVICFLVLVCVSIYGMSIDLLCFIIIYPLSILYDKGLSVDRMLVCSLFDCTNDIVIKMNYKLNLFERYKIVRLFVSIESERQNQTDEQRFLLYLSHDTS